MDENILILINNCGCYYDNVYDRFNNPWGPLDLLLLYPRTT